MVPHILLAFEKLEHFASVLRQNYVSVACVVLEILEPARAFLLLLVTSELECSASRYTLRPGNKHSPPRVADKLL